MRHREALDQLSRLDVLRLAIPAEDRVGQHVLDCLEVRARRAFAWAEAARKSTPVDRPYGKGAK